MSTLSNSYGFRENCDLISGSRNPGLQGIEREGERGEGDYFGRKDFSIFRKGRHLTLIGVALNFKIQLLF